MDKSTITVGGERKAYNTATGNRITSKGGDDLGWKLYGRDKFRKASGGSY